MAHVTRLQERTEWMTLSETVAHICENDYCNSNEALGKLRSALGEGRIPARWGSFRKNKASSIFSHEPVPTDPEFWQGVRICLDRNGEVHDGFYLRDESDKPVLPGRQLYLLRDRVFEIWWRVYGKPESIQKSSELQDKNYDNLTRRTASEPAVREALRAIFADPVNDRPNDEKAWRLMKKRLPSARRSQVRRILKEPEFADQQRSRGDHRKA